MCQAVLRTICILFNALNHFRRHGFIDLIFQKRELRVKRGKWPVHALVNGRMLV